MEQEYFTPHEIAKRFRVDDSTVRRWIRTGAIEAETIRLGKRTRHRISKATIETIEASSPPPLVGINASYMYLLFLDTGSLPN
jgi:excisionase family DNA binding protein